MSYSSLLPSKKTALVFSPFSGIWPHSLSEAQLMSQLDHDTYHVVIVNCGGAFWDHCAVRESLKIDLSRSLSLREPICKNCTKCARAISREYAFDQFWINDLISKEERNEIDRRLLEVTITNFSEFEFLKLPLGRLSCYETLIKFKKTSLNFNDQEYRYYLTSLKQAMLSAIALEHLLATINVDVSFIYSPQYAANIAAAEMLDNRNIPLYFVEGSSNIRERYTALRVWSWIDFKLVNPALTYYEKSMDVPNTQEMARLSGHLDELAKAKSYSVYSPPASGLDVAQFHGISKNQSVLLATLSSYDEAFSAVTIGGFPHEKFHSTVFIDQFDWIRELITWISNRPEYFLVIRLHPRDLPNKRESVVSEQSKSWNDLLTTRPTNVSIDYPSDKISLLDYFLTISAMTTGWSSTAVEGMLRGIPVITYDKNLPSFPSSIHLTGSTKEEYFANLETGLSKAGNPVHSIDAQNWLVYNFCKGTIRVAGQFVDQRWITKFRWLQLLFLGTFRLMPRLGRFVDKVYSRRYSYLDKNRFQVMISSGSKSLFES